MIPQQTKDTWILGVISVYTVFNFGNISRNILASSKGASRSDACMCASDSKESLAMPDRGLNTLLSTQPLVSYPIP